MGEKTQPQGPSHIPPPPAQCFCNIGVDKYKTRFVDAALFDTKILTRVTTECEIEYDLAEDNITVKDIAVIITAEGDRLEKKISSLGDQDSIVCKIVEDHAGNLCRRKGYTRFEFEKKSNGRESSFQWGSDQNPSIIIEVRTKSKQQRALRAAVLDLELYERK